MKPEHALNKAARRAGLRVGSSSKGDGRRTLVDANNQIVVEGTIGDLLAYLGGP